jgi:hypothetical protein
MEEGKVSNAEPEGDGEPLSGKESVRGLRIPSILYY